MRGPKTLGDHLGTDFPTPQMWRQNDNSFALGQRGFKEFEAIPADMGLGRDGGTSEPHPRQLREHRTRIHQSFASDLGAQVQEVCIALKLFTVALGAPPHQSSKHSPQGLHPRQRNFGEPTKQGQKQRGSNRSSRWPIGWGGSGRASWADQGQFKTHSKPMCILERIREKKHMSLSLYPRVNP